MAKFHFISYILGFTTGSLLISSIIALAIGISNNWFEAWFEVDSLKAENEGRYRLEYGVSHRKLAKIVDNSKHCSQKVSFRCVPNHLYFWLNFGDITATFTTADGSLCECRKDENCENMKSSNYRCDCKITSGLLPITGVKMEGYILNEKDGLNSNKKNDNLKTQLTGRTNIVIGELYCQHFPSEIMKMLLKDRET